MLVNPVASLNRTHFPVGPTGGKDFHKGESHSVELDLEGFCNGLLSFQDVGMGVHRGPHDVRSPLGQSQHLTQIHRVTVNSVPPASRRSRRFLAW